MSLNSAFVIDIFKQSIAGWHRNLAQVDGAFHENSIESLLWNKAQIDTIQWHEEDEIRRKDIAADTFIAHKRNIDRLNQIRTDTVEKIDDFIYDLYKSINKKQTARMNSETPAWLIDRMSILELKIFHMREQTERKDVDQAHIEACETKLSVLLEQETDMARCLDELLDEVSKGERYFKVYRQMKMYNDKSLNPSLYRSK
ncbi:MAG: DUF4254 domain-containing protein [Cytophagales bacterium]